MIIFGFKLSSKLVLLESLDIPKITTGEVGIRVSYNS